MSKSKTADAIFDKLFIQCEYIKALVRNNISIFEDTLLPKNVYFYKGIDVNPENVYDEYSFIILLYPTFNFKATEIFCKDINETFNDRSCGFEIHSIDGPRPLPTRIKNIKDVQYYVIFTITKEQTLTQKELTERSDLMKKGHT